MFLEIQQFIQSFKENDILPDPYVESTAHEIDPHQKLILQSLIQPWIDHSISVTYNLPENVTEKEVSDLYFDAWRLGLKGMTVYREGSRDGVLTTQKKKVEFNQHDAPKRPKELLCDIYSVKSKGIDWTVCVGLMEGKPYEVFAFTHVNTAGKKAGSIIKYSKGRYDLSVKDDGYYEDITSQCSDEENLLTRMISTSLRHGADIRFIVDQLNKSEGDITSFGKAIARTLYRYLKKDILQKKEICPECNEHSLINESGCVSCQNCGYTKC